MRLIFFAEFIASFNTRLERCSTIDVLEFGCSPTNSLFYLDKKLVGKFTLLFFCF